MTQAPSKLAIATVFSGIGAVEQAAKNLKIEHEIVFACDNGERHLSDSLEDIQEKIKDLSQEDAREYVNGLYRATKKPNLVKKSYFANYAITEDRWFEDIRFLSGLPFEGKVDILVGGSPCQSFSVYGKRKGLEDTRGTLFYDYARLIKEIRPKSFIFENVLGLLSHDNGQTWSIVQDVFKSLDYSISVQVLNAVDYGLPQVRKRLFVVGIRNDLGVKPFVFPRALPLLRASSDYLEASVADKYYVGEKGFKFITNPKLNGNRARINQAVIGCQIANQQFNWTGDFRVESPQPQHYGHTRIFVGEYDGKPAVARQLTPTETVRLMGFKTFNIIVPDAVMWRQCGNSIAVPVLEELLKELRAYIS